MDLLLLAELFDKTALIHSVAEYSYVGVFLFLLACGFGLPCPEEVPLVSGGYAVYQAGVINPARGGFDDALLMVGVALVGVLIGDLILYGLGRTLGRNPEKIPILGRHLTPKRIEKGRAMFQAHGAKTVFFGRFAFGIRAPVFFLAGSMQIPVRTFVLIDGLAALVSVPVSVLLAWYFGAELDRALDAVGRANHAIAAVVVVVLGIVLFTMWRRARALAAAVAEQEEQEEPASAASE